MWLHAACGMLCHMQVSFLIGRLKNDNLVLGYRIKPLNHENLVLV